MKKYFGILIALLVAIGAAIIPYSVHAMTQNDLGGHAYFTDNPDENGGRTMIIIFNKKATRAYEAVLHKEADGTYKPMLNAKEYNKALANKKNFNKYSYKTNTKGDPYYLLNKKGNKIYLPDHGWCAVQGDTANGFNVKSKDGDYDKNWTPAPINVEFSW